MFFSIIIPTFNNANFLKKALDSLKKQTDTNFELIIVDNHSTDKTSQIVAESEINNLTYRKIRNNGIIAKSRNLGIEISKGSWLMFLDLDDLFYKNKISFLNDKLNDDYDVVCNSEKIVNLDNGKSKIWRYGPNERKLYEKMLLYENRLLLLRYQLLKRTLLQKIILYLMRAKILSPQKIMTFF